jgi:DNA gyrase subunit B
LVGLEVKKVETVEPTTDMVYDFSVAEDESFVCGTGGICAHNTDADVDGGHIITLLLTFFFRYAPDLIKEGRLYVAELPLYRVQTKKNGRQYLYSDEEKDKLTKKGEIKTRGDGSLEITRFKGLGEMMPDQLGETALDPETRRLRQVTIEDISEAEDITTLLMGSRVDRRREYIQENALAVEVDV